jgi:hypothetical protein
MSRSHIYEEVEFTTIDGYPLFKCKVIKKEYSAIWQTLLTPEEKAKYDSLSTMEQLQIALLSNPFRALGSEE